MVGKWMFYISVVLALILAVENMVLPWMTGYFLLARTNIWFVVIGSIIVWFFMWFGLKTFLMSEDNNYDNEDY